jgi:hypothetical protein
MKIAICMSDNRHLQPNKSSCDYNSYTAYINTIYCLAYKYDFFYFQPYGNTENSVYVCIDPNTGEPRHASWAKLLAMSMLCKQDYDYIVCIDSDCVFLNIHKRLEEIIDAYPEKDFIIANNSPYHPDLPCCAFMICKNNTYSRTFLNDWYMFKNPASDSEIWRKVLENANKTYKTPLFTLGTYWEQDTLWILLQNPEIARHFQLLSEPIMVNDKLSGQFLIHISHERHEKRKPYFLGYVEHLEKETKFSFEHILSLIPCIQFDSTNIITRPSSA